MSRCVPPCYHGVPRSRGLPAEPVNATVSTEIESQPEEIPQILLSADTSVPVVKSVAENEPPKFEIMAEKETSKPAKTQTAQLVKSTASASEPRNGEVRVVDGERQIYLLGFGWIKDESGESYGTFAADMYENGNKIGVMCGGTMVGNPGDKLTGNKVGINGRRGIPPK